MTRAVAGRLRAAGLAVLVALAVVAVPAAQPGSAPRPPRKHLLAWADVRNGYQHDSISHALATIERLGRESGLYDTWIRTDSQLITKHPITFPIGAGIAKNPELTTTERAPNEQFLSHNLNFFDAIFFFGVREIDLTPEQRADLLSFVHDDGKGFVAAHSAATSFFSWPEFGDMLGGRFDEHPWGITDATVVVDDPNFPAMKNFPRAAVFHDEHYQLKDFSRDKVRVLAHLDASKLDLHRPLVHRTDGDFPVAWAKMYGQGRVFYSTLGHSDEEWDNPAVQQMYFGAIKWALRLVDGDATPLGARRAPAGPLPPGADPLPPGEGRAAVVTMCGASTCHGVASSVATRRTRLDWQSVIEDMREKGAPGSDEDESAAMGYLLKFFGRVNVNKAPAPDIALVLGLTAGQAGAIVAHRAGHGSFAGFDDLSKVEGLDLEKLTKEKAAILFSDR